MLARNIDGQVIPWDGQPFEHPLHPEWGPAWKPCSPELWSAQELAEADFVILPDTPPAVTPDAIKAECRRRIDAKINQTARENLLGAQARGNRLSPDDKSAWDAGFDWIEDMRAKCRELIAAQDATYADDSHWPACPEGVVALAARY